MFSQEPGEDQPNDYMEDHQVFLGLGSNLGYPILHCYQAIYRINRLPKTKVLERSSFYQTEPFGYEQQDWFINLVLKIRTGLTARELLAHLQEIEKNLGRQKLWRWGPRCIDLDILFFNQQTIDEANLCIPHPLLQERNFVLQPLAEVAPDLRHPVLNKTVQELALICQDQKGVKKIE